MRIETAVAGLALVAIAVHLWLNQLPPVDAGPWSRADWPLLAALAIGGVPLVAGLARRLLQRDFSSDLLAGLSIVTAVLLGEYLAGTLVVLMLSGGQAIEAFAVRRASSALEALARRMPSRAHRRLDGATEDIALEAIEPGDTLVVFPHETCPVDGIVLEGRSAMDESTHRRAVRALEGAGLGRPLRRHQRPWGADHPGERRAVDSRYARIMQVMRESEQRRPRSAASVTSSAPSTPHRRGPPPRRGR